MSWIIPPNGVGIGHASPVVVIQHLHRSASRWVQLTALVTAGLVACSPDATGHSAPASTPGEDGNMRTCQREFAEVEPPITDAWPNVESLHLREHTDSVSMHLSPDGRAMWVLQACDLFGEGLAQWNRQGRDVMLSPPPGYLEFYWPDELTFRRRVEQVVFSREADGTIISRVSPREGGIFVQTWEPGLECADCCCDPGWYICDFPFERYWSEDAATDFLEKAQGGSS